MEAASIDWRYKAGKDAAFRVSKRSAPLYLSGDMSVVRFLKMTSPELRLCHRRLLWLQRKIICQQGHQGDQQVYQVDSRQHGHGVKSAGNIVNIAGSKKIKGFEFSKYFRKYLEWMQ